MPDAHLLTPAGFRAAGVACGLKQSGKPDLALLVCDTEAAVAAAFTTNKVQGAAVTVGKDVAAGGTCQALVVNSGNSNSATGRQGIKDARRMAKLTADALDLDPNQVIPGSTGIIGVPLSMPKVAAGIADAAIRLGDSAEHADAFAEAIMTTDLVKKTAAASFKSGSGRVTVAGVCKGSGMIGPMMSVATPGRPKQATMLAYLTTDADISAASLRKALGAGVERSFNRTTVDGHASTCDTAVLLTSRRGPRPDAADFAAAVQDVCQSLARQIAADGEGATHLVTVRVSGAATEKHADAIARTIAASPLVKTAVHGHDPNWGRIVSAAGYAPAPLDVDACTLTLCGHTVFRRGKPAAYDEAAASAAMRDAAEVVIHLKVGRGPGDASVWTCDLSREYITINADYTT